MSDNTSVNINPKDFAVIPEHVAIIMDGNGRWAKKRFLPRSLGHLAGRDRFVETVRLLGAWGVKTFTVYALSTENWARDKEEVSAIISLVVKSIKQYIDEIDEKNVRLYLLGDLTRFPDEVRELLLDAVERLKNNTGMNLCICLSYGGRDEIVRAAKKLISRGDENITEKDFADALYTGGLRDPDLIIRPGGELRVSNFLLWQSAYSEYYFSDVLWPDFDENELAEAIREFGKRKRRFGKEK